MAVLWHANLATVQPLFLGRIPAAGVCNMYSIARPGILYSNVETTRRYPKGLSGSRLHEKAHAVRHACDLGGDYVLCKLGSGGSGQCLSLKIVRHLHATRERPYWNHGPPSSPTPGISVLPSQRPRTRSAGSQVSSANTWERSVKSEAKVITTDVTRGRLSISFVSG
jgi:hypothetical protein